MNNKTYNNIVNLIGFITTVFFIVGKIVGFITASWWLVLVPFITSAVFNTNDD